MNEQRKNPYRRPTGGGERPGLRQLPKDFDDLATGKVERLRRPRRAPDPIQDEREGAVIPGVRNSEARTVYDARVAQLRRLVSPGREQELRAGLEDARRLALWRARNVTDYRAFTESVIGVDPALAQELATEAESDAAAKPWPSHAVALAVRAEAALVTQQPGARAQLREHDGVLELVISLPLADVGKAVDALSETGRAAYGLRRFLRTGEERGGRFERDAGEERSPRAREPRGIEPRRGDRRAEEQDEELRSDSTALADERDDMEPAHATPVERDYAADVADESDDELDDAGPDLAADSDLREAAQSDAEDVDVDDEDDAADLEDGEYADAAEAVGPDSAREADERAAESGEPTGEGRGPLPRRDTRDNPFARPDAGRSPEAWRDERGARDRSRDADARHDDRTASHRDGNDQRGAYGPRDDKRGSFARRDDDRRSFPRRDDDKRGSFARRDDDKRSFPRRDDDKRGSFPRRDDDKRGSFARRDDDKRSFPRRDDDKRGSFPRRDDDKRSFPRRDDDKRRSGPQRARDDRDGGGSAARRDDKRWSGPKRARDDRDAPKKPFHGRDSGARKPPKRGRS